MTEEQPEQEGQTEAEGQQPPEDEGGADEGRFKRGWGRGVSFLSAFKEAIDETLEEAKERGDLNPERAKDMVRSALDRAQEAAGEAKSRLEFVPRKDFEALEARVAALESRLADQEGE
ncbi:MAG: hypothetical protein ACR2QM_03055 [Longimicrobiales bacterium]